jgi:S1-C subfamily serine protease
MMIPGHRNLRRIAMAGLCLAAVSLGPPATAAAISRLQSTDGAAFVRVIGNLHSAAAANGGEQEGVEGVEIASGSGFVISPSGLVVTNQHVISGGKVGDLGLRVEVSRVEVSVWKGAGYETYDATVAASDPDLDLAVLQTTAIDAPYVPLGDSDAIELGQSVTVVGFPFGSAAEVGRSDTPDVVPSPSVTSGSLSAARADDAGRTRYLQTDATVNPGSSGGPILDEDGFALGVVRMKLSLRDRPEESAAFGIPINRVKDFLEANGVLYQVPAQRLHAGGVQDLDWKGMRVELPDGMVDQSPERIEVSTGGSAGPVSFLAVRFVSRADPRTIESALLRGSLVPGFVPAQARDPRRWGHDPSRALGCATGTSNSGASFRVEYAIAELGSRGEKVAARFLGPPDDVGFNLSLLRRGLEGMQTEPLLTEEVRAPLRAALEEVALARAPRRVVLLPTGWSREPSSRSGCVSVPQADDGIAASPAGDFTVSLRVLRWKAGRIDPAALARACRQPAGTPPLGFATSGRRLGTEVALWGTFQTHGDEVLLLEAEAPPDKLPFLADIYVDWVKRSAE